MGSPSPGPDAHLILKNDHMAVKPLFLPRERQHMGLRDCVPPLPAKKEVVKVVEALAD